MRKLSGVPSSRDSLREQRESNEAALLNQKAAIARRTKVIRILWPPPIVITLSGKKASSRSYIFFRFLLKGGGGEGPEGVVRESKEKLRLRDVE